MTATPNGLPKAAAENTDAVANSAKAVKAAVASVAEAAPLPAPPAAEVAEAEAAAAPAVEEAPKAPAKRGPKKVDPLKDISDMTKLPVAVVVGQITISVQEYSGRPVASVSLLGWVGDAPLKILASDLYQVEKAIADLRKLLS